MSSVRRSWRLVLGGSVLTLLAACSGGGGSTSTTAAGGSAPSGSPGGNSVLRVVQASEVQSLDPNTESKRTSVRIADEILEAPTKYEWDGSKLVLKPGLAQSWAQTSPTTWRFKLRPGVTFTNGEPLTAEAVAKTLDAYRQNKAGGNTTVFSDIEIKAVDDLTFDVTTKVANYGALPAKMSYFVVYPPKYFAEKGATGFGNAPIGTGPYQLDKWQKGVVIRLTANQKYWGGVPKIGTLEFSTVGDPASRIAQLQTGQVDVAADVPPAMVQRAEGLSGVKVAAVQSQTRVFLAFGTGTAPTDNPLVRKAISHAIDTDTIIKNLFGGRAYPFHGLFVSGELGYQAQFAGNGYDPELAKKLLAEAGYANGLTIDFHYTIGATVLDEQVAEAVAAQLKDVGITAKMDGGPFQVVAKKWRQPGSSGIHLLSFNPVYNDSGFLFQAYFTTNSAWSALATDPKLDQLATAAAGTVDEAARSDAYTQAQQLAITDQAYWAPLYALQENYAITDKLAWKPRPDALFAFETATLAG